MDRQKPNTMLLRTAVLLLLLCTTSGLCATLGLYNTEAPEEEVQAAVIDTAVDENTLEEGVAAADSQVDDSAAQESNLLAKILGVDNQPADHTVEVDVPVADGAAGTDTDSDRTVEDVPAEEVLTQDQPSEEDGNEIRPVQTEETQKEPLTHEDDSSWSLNSIRSGFQSMHGYFDSLVELVGGRNGVCEYRCRYGEPPQPRPGYQLPEPNGCSSSLVGLQFDLGIPAMTECCNNLDKCYDTCGTNKYDCDAKFRLCLHDICSDLKKSLGFGSKVQACESMADALYNTVWTFGCRPYMTSQRAACFCQDEEKDEL